MPVGWGNRHGTTPNKYPMSESKCYWPEGRTTLPAGGAHTDGHVEIAAEDWDVMFRSVLERLRLASGEVAVQGPVLKAPDPVTLLQIIVLECVSALDQLHVALKLDRAHAQWGQNRELT